MKTVIPWIAAGVGAGIATWFMLRNQTAPALRTAGGPTAGYGSVDDAADRTASWGDRQRIAGTGTRVLGKMKEGLGRITGDPNLADSGAADQAEGTLRDAAGKVANAAGQTLKDLNF